MTHPKNCTKCGLPKFADSPDIDAALYDCHTWSCRGGKLVRSAKCYEREIDQLKAKQ